MDFPKIMKDFMLHDQLGRWTFKGKELVSAHYIKVGTRMDLYIRTIADTEGRQSYEIQVRDSYIRGIDSLAEAVRIAEEVIEENELFVTRETGDSPEL